ncbi:hypothetical protein Ancab_021986 [Ancistrocladus abbreviatus]
MIVSTCEAQLTASSSRDENVNAKNLPVGRSQNLATNCSALSNPSSIEDGTCNITPCGRSNENQTEHFCDYYKNAEKIDSTNLFSRLYGQNQSPNLASNEDHAMTKICSTDDLMPLRLRTNKYVRANLAREQALISDPTVQVSSSPLW